MDRFIGGVFIYILVGLVDLKSSMDRFIVEIVDGFVAPGTLFKIQYG